MYTICLILKRFVFLPMKIETYKYQSVCLTVMADENDGTVKQDPLKEKEGIYTEEGREELIEDGEISASEEGFMEGAEDRGELNCCSQCGKLLQEDKEGIYERKFDGEIKLFCSSEHAEHYAQKHEKIEE